MFAVHGLWSPGRGLLLWAEDGERPATTSSRSLRSARPHPFAVPSAELAELHPGKPVIVTLLLPSRRSGPVASPELVRSAPIRAGRSSPSLLPWSVPAVIVDPTELDDPAEQVRYGASVAHLREMLRFADGLAARGRVLPTLVREPGPEARWRLIVQGRDAVVFDALVSALPPVGRAERQAPGATTGPDPGELVGDAVAVLTDTAVRDRLARADALVPLVPPRRGRVPRRIPVTEGWLAALLTSDGRVEADERELDELARALEPWDGVGTESAGPARASFRLTEVGVLDDPAAPDGPSTDQTGDGTRWQLQFHLQSAADPSLLVPADRIWGGGAGKLARLIGEPQELLLAELGRASLVYPALTPSLRQARPESLDLDLEGAARFLTEDAALLLGAGFGVQLPAGWDGGRRLGLRLSVRSTPTAGVVTRSGLGREQVADFRWGLAVGDDVLDAAELDALVAAKAPLVRLRGNWVTIDPEQLRAGLEFLRRAERSRAGRHPPSAADVLALAQRHPAELADELPLPVTGVDAQGWLGDLLDGTAERSLEPLEPPPGFTAWLRPYQRRGLSWLAFLSSLGLGACLADDMGLGKTVQLLALEAHERAGLPASRGATLLLCPMSLVGTWQREAARFVPGLRVLVHHGGDRIRGDGFADAVAAADLVVTTYGTATRDIDMLAAVAWRRIVLDEAQAIKNSLAATSKAVRRLRAEHRIALTGTPMENRLAELWSVMDFLNPGVLGSTERFRQRFAVPVERYGDTEAAGLLRRITRPYLLRRMKTDPNVIDDLPEKIEITQHYRLTREQASLYQTVVDDMMEKIEGSDGIARRGNVLAAMAKLKQVCNHPAQLLHDGSEIGRRSGKVARLEEILTEILAEGDKVLCFTQFTEFAQMLVPHLCARFDQEVLYLHGGTNKRQRDEMIERFRSPGGPSIFLLSLKAGGTGLTLTAANHVVHLDRWWNPAVEDQATDRAFRIGQRRTVQVRKFVCPGTVEERIDEMITSKKTLSGMVISDGERWLTELSTVELREVLTLGAEAVDGTDE
ncbi:DEAD/DEAH box helicase [Pseudonocardia asaccharolytica]|uniref:Helicase HelZ n=1 Tax=Pseudonocardia asaccharolytica DSM 44247 = NBRC 16224 TaxID=1123024 RepID=A0A511CZT9_9PSEU|nr:DEAD/DEAH box helicase [Pseudonocardia asaccharolytica]GEL18059.1 helicase HelZ [Pseudonocardia asaccharolytica DSM 44247 = NBRC 16224]